MARLDAIELTHEKARKAIEGGKSFRPYMDKLESYPSYHMMVWNFTAWDFDSLYPGLKEFEVDKKGGKN